jgi:phosphatidylglycerol---prolipoprotein diacylglyceryl transferase
MTFLLAESYFHTLDPYAIQLTQNFGIRWYGLSYAAGFLIAWLFISWMARTGRSPLEPKRVGDLMFYVIVGVLVGGRVGYILFYDPKLLIDFSTSFPWWGLLAINRGGMASHGGMIGVFIAIVLFSRKSKVPALHVLDLAAIGALPGLFLGRLANFVNGELIGRAIPDQQNPPWWSMKFPQEMRHWTIEQLSALRPIVDYAGVSSSDWTGALAAISSNPDAPPDWASDMVHIVIDRLILSAQQGNDSVIEHLSSILTAVYPSQIIQAATDGPILLGILALLWMKPRKPGVIGGAFFLVYGVLRIATETFRQPDEGVALLLGLTRGQLLSVFMVIAGAALIWIATRRPGDKLGGLLLRN